MRITKEIIEAYLNCKTKGFLKLIRETGTKSDYDVMTDAASRASREGCLAKLIAIYGDGIANREATVSTATLGRGAMLMADATLEDDSTSICFDALKRANGVSKLGDHHYLPVLHNHGDTIGRSRRLLLAVLGLVLARVQEVRPADGLVARGRDGRLSKVCLNPDLYREAEQILDDVKRIQQVSEAPPLMLNKHCHFCEFRQRCRSEAVDKDDISLLESVGEKELRKLNRRGIFTLVQLSCTFRPRRKGKRATRQGDVRYSALHALAIRENKVHVCGTPDLPRRQVQVFFDAEGNANGSFTYLLGVRVVEGDAQAAHAFWADSPDQETDAFDDFLDLLDGDKDFTLFHYGSYEKKLLHRMRKVVKRKGLVDRAIDNAVNVLATIRAHVYFPTFSNGLKDVGRYLGSSWTAKDASGLQSLVWRAHWEETRQAVWKDELMTYNAEDCVALKRVTECIQAIGDAARIRGVEATSGPASLSVVWADEVGGVSNRREFCHVKFSLPDFEHVNQCAYFDYQREKVFLRTNKAVRRACVNRRKRGRRARPTREIELKDDVCPFCHGARVTRLSEKRWSKMSFDLEFGRGGIRRRVIRCTAFWHRCDDCQRRFHPESHKRRDKHLHGLKSWAMCQYVVHRVNLSHLETMFEEWFGLSVTRGELHEIRSLMASRYQKTCDLILERIVAASVAHADETGIHLQKEKGYVWVLTSLEDVLYLYKPSREAAFLHGLLREFKGVLVSDFYSGYDSLGCPQQKCLIHLIRDFNADLMSNPYDKEFKSLAGDFGKLVRPIVDTIDKHGLKKEYLQRHTADVSLFFRGLEIRSYRSEVANGYRERLTRNEHKLFTFLNYDGVPWNNNPAEHAVKAFACFRRTADGSMGERGLSDYLVLLSVLQTCEYRGISFRDFLLSQEQDIDAFCRRGRRKNPSPTIEVYPEGFSRTYRK